MKKKHPFLYTVIRRGIIVVLLGLMALTAYNQSSGALISPEGIFADVITPFQGIVSKVTQAFSD